MSMSVVSTIACIFFLEFFIVVIWIIEGTLLYELLNLLATVCYVLSLRTILVQISCAIGKDNRISLRLLLNQRVWLKSLLLLEAESREVISLAFTIRYVDICVHDGVLYVIAIVLVDNCSILMPIAALWLSWMVHNPDIFIWLRIYTDLTRTLVTEELSHVLRNIWVDR